jgi:hypothetical protein
VHRLGQRHDREAAVDLGLRPSNPACERLRFGAEREQFLVPRRLFRGGERHLRVLRQLRGLARDRVHALDQRRDMGQPGEPGGGVAPRPCRELVPAVRFLHEDRGQYAGLADAIGKLLDAGQSSPRIVIRRGDLVEREPAKLARVPGCLILVRCDCHWNCSPVVCRRVM